MTAAADRRVEKALIVEILMVLALVVLAMLLYWRPAATGMLSPRWWHWVALGALFFAILALHTWRARHRSHRALHQAIREDAAEEIEEESSAGLSDSADPPGEIRVEGDAASQEDRT
ncbi:MAG: hypothetical protein WD766_06485 [Gemmatimonadota bacterium]